MAAKKTFAHPVKSVPEAIQTDNDKFTNITGTNERRTNEPYEGYMADNHGHDDIAKNAYDRSWQNAD